ncbi:sulfotransferase [Microbacterium sp. RU33B]|uniref:sulfotransferase family protein n=1 Tax=Microbacterium sp. RU33B TaxID=1907390 RepID=UPI00095DD436|nr:sulfotransferase domain-containing protein [Microbacterium sp. RU33B]SIT84271.1 Sulfotransferase domain-containing protein [Microbacterium sp. RU33B]
MSSIKDRAPAWMKDIANVTTRGWAMATAADRPLPDYLIIGCKRGGTTSMFNYLVRHPGVMHMYPEIRGTKSTDYFFKGSGRSERWYRSHFPSERHRRSLQRNLGYRPLSGEASPYYVWDPRIAGKVRDVAPEVKSILLLREPVRRAWSHYQERVQNKVEPLSFADALDAEDARLEGEVERMLADPSYYSPAHDFYSYRSRGDYAPQIRNWLEHFPREQLLIVYAEDLYRNTESTFSEVCDFLEIPRIAMPTKKSFNSTWRTSDLPPETETNRLAAVYEPLRAEVEELVGKSAPW